MKVALSLHYSQYLLKVALIDYFNRLCDCPEGSSSSTGLGSSVHCSSWAGVDRDSNAIPVHPITAGSAKLPDSLIKEAEETLYNNEPIRKGDPMQRVNSMVGGLASLGELNR